MLEVKRQQLREIYQKYATELNNVPFLYNREAYSYPYYLHIPDNWYNSKFRFLIVGKEGYGFKNWHTPIEEAQAFNRDYLRRQFNLPGQSKYERSSSPFWRRIRSIASQFDGTQFSITWTNLDKIHRSCKGNCKLGDKDRIALHSTPTKILSEELSILQPTHVIYFGWYGISLEDELPMVHKQLYPAGPKDSSQWKGGKTKPILIDHICHIFTYHPNWGQRTKGYENWVIQTIMDNSLAFYRQRNLP